MPNIYLSFGYDDERPYGDLADSQEGKEHRKNNIEFVSRLNYFLDGQKVPRTIFILGQYLEKCLDDYSPKDLREIYNNGPFLEIQQHSYSHQTFRPIIDRGDKIPVSIGEFTEDINKANSIIGEILDITPNGLRVPLGYSGDLSDLPQLVSFLKNKGFRYVSSDLRGKTSQKTELNIKRQPHNYGNIGFPEVMEIPCHGWQDVIFTKGKSGSSYNSDGIFSSYKELIDKAKEMAAGNGNSRISIALCLHPWAVMEYDNNFDIHKKIIDYARQSSAEIVSFGNLAEVFANDMVKIK